MKPLDYSLYNKVRAKFPAQPCTIIFVSLVPENLEELTAQSFSVEQFADFRLLVDQHVEKTLPYAAIGGLTEDDVGLFFACHEFIQEEDLLTGQITSLSIGTYHNKPVDLEGVKRDLQKLTSGLLLSGNA